MSAVITIAALIALYYNYISLKAVVDAGLADAGWKELFKMAVNVAIIIYAYFNQITL